jgi:hypothetical protein
MRCHPYASTRSLPFLTALFLSQLGAAALGQGLGADAVSAGAVRQEPKADAPLPRSLLQDQARAFFAALEAGDTAKVVSFQPAPMREGMGEEERQAFGHAVKGAQPFLASAAGKFQRVALERTPTVEGLPEDLVACTASWELEIRSGEGAESLLHGVRFRWGIEREEVKPQRLNWPITEFDVELESVQPASGMVLQGFDLAPLTLTGALSELTFGVDAKELAERGSAPFPTQVLNLQHLEPDPETAGSRLVEQLRRAIAERSGAALLEVVHLPDGAEAPDAQALVDALAEFEGLGERLRAMIRPGALPRSATRASVQVVTKSGTQVVEWSKRNGRWALDDLAWEPKGEAAGSAFHLRELLSR